MSNSPYIDPNDPDTEANGRQLLLPDIYKKVDAWSDLADSLDKVLGEQVDEPALMYLDLRDLTRDSDRWVLKATSSMLGFSKKSYYMDEDRLNRVVTHLPKFRSQNTTDVYKDFLAFLCGRAIGVDELWTDDYFCFFSVPYGPKLIDDYGNKLVEQQPWTGWFNTTHVMLRANARAIFPDSKDPYDDMRNLFYSIAPGYLVLDFIGNVADLFQTQMELNVGVIEGHTVDEQRYRYEQLNVSNSDWKQGRDLPWARHRHAQSRIGQNSVLLTGGQTSEHRVEDLSCLMVLEQGSWLNSNATSIFIPEGKVTCLATCPPSSQTVAGTDQGELAVSADGGVTWTKVWSPFFNSKRPITGLCWSQDHGLWMATTIDGYYAVAEDPTQWNDADGVRCVNKAVSDFDALEFVSTDYVPGIVVNGVVCGNSIFIVYCNDGTVYSSLDGTTGSWKVAKTGQMFDIYAGVYDLDRGQFLLVGECGWGWITAGGRQFTDVNIGVGDHDATWAYYLPAGMVNGQQSGRYVVGGRNNTFGVSDDGLLWALCDPLFRALDITAGGYLPFADLYFAAGYGRYALSNDSQTWHVYESPFLAQYPDSTDSGLRPVVPQTWAYLEKDRRLIIGCSGGAIFASAAAERFYQVSDLPEPRAAHAQVSREHGKALVVGGVSTDQEVVDTTYEYDQATDTWDTLSPLPVATRSGALVSIPDGQSADNWTLRASRFGIVDILDTAYFPAIDNFWAVGRVGRVSTSDYGIKWELQTSPFPSAQFVGAAYNPWSGRVMVAVNTVPENQMLIASSMDGGVTWQSQELAAPYPAVTALTAFERIERLPPDIRVISRRTPVAGIVPASIPPVIVDAVASGYNWNTEDFTAINPSTNAGLKDCFCSYYSETYDRHYIGSYGGVYYSSDNGETWVWGDASSTTVDDGSGFQLLPVTAIAEIAESGLLIAFHPINALIQVSRDGGATWAYEGDNGTGPAYPPVSGLETTWFSTRSSVYQVANYVPAAQTLAMVDSSHEAAYSTDGGHEWFTFYPFSSVNTSTSYALDSIVFSDGLTWAVVGEDDNGSYSRFSSYKFLPSAGGIDQSGTAAFPSGTSLRSVCATDSLFANLGLIDKVFLAGTNYLAAHVLGVFGASGLANGDTTPHTVMVPSLLGPTGPAMLGPLTARFVAGSMGAQTVRYVVTALDGLGETQPSAPIIVTIPDSTEGSGVEISWTRIPHASGYKVYKQVGAVYALVSTITVGNVNFYVDDGGDAVQPNIEITPPVADSTGLRGLTNWTIAKIRYCRSSSTLVAATTTGHIVWSRDGKQWVGVRNPTTVLSGNPYAESGGMGQVTDVFVHESSDRYVATATGGGIFVSNDGVTFDSSKSNSFYQTLTDIGYSAERDQAMLATIQSGAVLTSSFPTLRAFGVNEIQWAQHEDVAATGFDPDVHNYTYFVYKRRGSDRSAMPHALTIFMASTGNSYLELTWEHDSEAAYYDIYRMESATGGADPDFENDEVSYLGQLEPPDPTSGITTITFVDRHQSMSLVAPEFTGTGLNDIEIDGDLYNATGFTYRIFRVEISVAKQWAPDTISIVRSQGPASPPQNMASSGSPLIFDLGTGPSTNVKVWWAATTGHTEGDRWAFWVFPNPSVVGTGISVLPAAVTSYHDLFDIVAYRPNGLNAVPNACRYYSNPITGMSGWLQLCANGTILKSLDAQAQVWTVLDTSLSPALAGANIRDMASAVLGTGSNQVYTSVFVGDDRFLASTPDVFNSQIKASSYQGFTGDIMAVSYNPGTRRFTAVGQDSCIGHSTDGSTWRMVYESSILTTWRAVAQGQGLWTTMIVGDNGAFSTSFDGVVWTLRNIGYTTADINVILTHPDASDSRALLAGSRVTAMRTLDGGVTWDKCAIGLPVGVDPSAPVDITGGCVSYVADTISTVWLVCCTQGLIYRSVDMVTWNVRVVNQTRNFRALAAKPNSATCLAVCSNTNAVYRSLDQGDTWSRVASDSTVLPLLSGFTDISYSTTGGMVIATSFDGKLAKSLDDGATWEIVTIQEKPWSSRKYNPNNPALIDFQAVTASPTGFVVAGSEGDILVADVNASDFSLKDSKLNGQAINSLSYGASTYVGGGDRGALVTSFAQFDARIMYVGGVDGSGAVVDTCHVFDYDGGLGSWSTSSQVLTVGRYDHAAAVLSDGTVLVAGGTDSNGTPLASTERYLPHRDLWVSDISLPYAKGWLRSSVMSSDAYIAFGGGPDPDRSALVLLPAMVVPAAPTLSPGQGILNPGTYFYRVSVATTAGETVPTNQVRLTITEIGGVVLDWEPVPNAVYYCIYGREEGAVTLIAKIPGHLTSYTDLGVNLTSAQIFRREDTTEDGWFELVYSMPLSRENCAVSMIDDDLISVTGGYKDRRTFRITPQPANFIDPLKQRQMLLLNYVADGYWDPGYVTDLP